MNMIDIHSHFLPRTWPDLAARFGGAPWPWMKHLGSGKAMLMCGTQEFRPVSSACWDPAVRLEAMERDGVDVQVMCVTPLLFAYQPVPGTVAFVGYGNTTTEPDAFHIYTLTRVADDFFVKFSYLFRME